MNTFNFNTIPSQKGRIAIITGANIGLGYETTKFFVKKDIKVVMACRNIEKAEKAKQEIVKTVPGAEIIVMKLDLNSLQSVRNFASAYKEQFDRLDLLINNAGIMVPPFAKTEDGFESQMGVNYFSHFELTGLLLPLLEKTEGARIVSLSSMAHKNGKIDLNNLNAENGYSKFGAYSQSKLACLMFAYELKRRLEKSGSHVISVAAHPGGATTNLGQHVPKFLYTIVETLFGGFFNTPEMGALPTVYAALGEDIKSGDYTGPDGFNEIKGHKPKKVSSTKYSHRTDISKLLWDASERLTGFTYSI
ncbi:SDR family NAD(P)-dependent oxidoreductase [Flammeovirga pectinis]|uniref:SDR family NAD(P)-dependent oxidoreductase n=1 Tax=Flammeovirga pectinis TaxID=2494373 RepID=A0A3S9P4D3_9BACT|nr:oxidoreductase [Flammeovirga pectinis]AZQ63070.1 SDR family NAD(P)-dependent oxidoreductase [Flammeovirga pectinis]